MEASDMASMREVVNEPPKEDDDEPASNAGH